MPSAGIVYEGVLARGSQAPDENNANQNQNRYEGTLFNGLKFWISSKVPDRKSLMDSVKANGGKIVLLEKHADLLIADHARKDVPAGSVSWKYITDSISEGELADIDIYKIDVKAKGGRTAKGAGSSSKSVPGKRTRTPFTPQDDHLLIHWVLQGEGIARGQGSARGNQLYKDLADKYPHHTFQSWRDRFIKLYDHINRDSLAAMLPRDFQPPPPSGAPSLDEDDQIVIDFVKRSRQSGIPEQNMYKKLAEQHPHRSWQDWRSRCIKLQAVTNREASEESDHGDHAARDTPEPSLPEPSLLKPSVPKPSVPKPTFTKPAPSEPTLPEPTPKAVTRPQVTATPKSADQVITKKRPSAALNRVRQDIPTKSSPVRPVNPTITSSAHKKSSPHPTPSRFEDYTRRARQLREEKRKTKSATIIQRAWRRHQAKEQIPWRQAIKKFQALAQGFVIRQALAPFFDDLSSQYDTPNEEEDQQFYSEDEGSVDLGHSVEPNTASQPSQTPREQFYHYFDLYNQAVENSPVRWVKIGTKSVETWDLWSAVTGQDVPAHARDWQVVAEDLGFDWIAEPDVPNQLQAAYQEHLADFEDNLEDFMADELFEDEEEGEENEEVEGVQLEEEEEVDAEEEKEQDHNTTEFRSSPPIVGAALKSSGGLKRNVEQLISSPLASMTRKRQRYSLEDEVPESPPKRRGSPLPPIPEVTSRPEEEAADVTLVNDEGDAAEEMPMYDDDGGDYEAEEEIEEREDDDDVFYTQLQQPRQTTAPKPQATQNRPATQPSVEDQTINIPSDSDSDSDSSSDAFGTPINPPQPAPERKPVPAAVPVVRRQLPPREGTAPPRFRIPSEQPAVTNAVPCASILFSPTTTTSTLCTTSIYRPGHSTHPPPPNPQHQQPPPSSSSYPPPLPKHPLPHSGRNLGDGIASEDPLAIVKRYTSLGFRRSDCCKGVFATTHDPLIAGHAIYAVAKYKKLPGDVPGIWTESDDEDLKRVDRFYKKQRTGERDGGDGEDGGGGEWEEDEERIMKVLEMRRVKEVERRLEEKHGRKRMESRRVMLRYWPRV
ncbi:hypothetical protein B0T20DRAFT_492913 [Sordaria brevicollis]|uniref:Telomeric repeat-binding factor 2-interacting protein 1 n=1 Tax=Sordaria brevicollis TaxID=83679 RepID=A0AAE0UF97_SORBR|nr:hypothetical protein B0T20DRAFT_492913 [Sordaria brevicollis]